MRKVVLALVIGLFAVAVFLRFYNLGAVPLGLNKDEAAIGYNAYSILQTGKDEHGVSHPLYFQSYNDYKLPVYIYMTALAEKFLGPTQLAVRLPSAIMGLIMIAALMLLIRVLSRRWDLAIVTGLFLAYNPWQFFFSRTGFEVNVATSLAVIGSLIFVWAVKKKGNIWYLLLSILFFALSIYSYNVTRLLAPILFCLLIYLNYSQVKTWPMMTKKLCGLFALLVLVPLVYTLKSQSGMQNQTSGVFINGVYAKAQNIELRSYLINQPPLLTKLFFNTDVLLFWEYFRNIVRSFSTDFFFTVGPKSVNGITHFGVFYPFELLTVVVGIYTAVKKRVIFLRYFLFWLIISILIIALTQEVPHPTRSFTQVIPLTVFSAYGALVIWGYLTMVKGMLRRRAAVIGTVGLACYAVIYYMSGYFFLFPTNQAKVWHSVDQELVAYLDKHEGEYQHIVIDNNTDISYTALAFYGRMDPQEFQKKAQYEPDSLLMKVGRLGKYEFRSINWADYPTDLDTLYVTAPDSYTNKPILKTFRYPQHPVVETIGGVLTTYPTQDPAYVLIESQKTTTNVAYK